MLRGREASPRCDASVAVFEFVAVSQDPEFEFQDRRQKGSHVSRLYVQYVGIVMMGPKPLTCFWCRLQAALFSYSQRCVRLSTPLPTVYTLIRSTTNSPTIATASPSARENPINPPAHSHRTQILTSHTTPPTPSSSIARIDPNRASALHRNFSKPPIPGCHHRYQDSASVQIQPKWNAPCLFMFHPAETCFRGTARGLGSAVVQRCTAWDRLVPPRIRDVSEEVAHVDFGCV